MSRPSPGARPASRPAAARRWVAIARRALADACGHSTVGPSAAALVVDRRLEPAAAARGVRVGDEDDRRAERLGADRPLAQPPREPRRDRVQQRLAGRPVVGGRRDERRQPAARQRPRRRGRGRADRLLPGGRVLREQPHQPAPAALALARGGGLLLRVALGRLGRELVDVGEDRLAERVDRVGREPARDAGLDEPPPRQPRADPVGGEQRVEAAAGVELAAAEVDVRAPALRRRRARGRPAGRRSGSARPRRRAARPARTRPPSPARSPAPRARSRRSSRPPGRAARGAGRRAASTGTAAYGRDACSIVTRLQIPGKTFGVCARGSRPIEGYDSSHVQSAQDLQPRGGVAPLPRLRRRDRAALEHVRRLERPRGAGDHVRAHGLRRDARLPPPADAPLVPDLQAGRVHARRARLDGGPGPRDDVGRRPPQAPRAHRQGRRPALAARPRRRHQGRARGPLVRAHGLALRPRRPGAAASATRRTSTRTAACR